MCMVVKALENNKNTNLLGRLSIRCSGANRYEEKGKQHLSIINFILLGQRLALSLRLLILRVTSPPLLVVEESSQVLAYARTVGVSAGQELLAT